jgi:hypothetical protein
MRNDDMIISAGYNIAGPEVMAVLLGGERQLLRRGRPCAGERILERRSNSRSHRTEMAIGSNPLSSIR